MFFIGIVPGLATLLMRRSLKESAIFERAKAANRISSDVSEIFRRPFLGRTLTATLLSAGALGGNYTILTWLPTFLREVRHLSILHTGTYLGATIIGSFFGYILCAHLSDALGRRKTFVIMAITASITVILYTMADIRAGWVLLMGFLLGFSQSGIMAGMGAALAELFPTKVRGNGQGFSYNAGRGIGAVMPALVGYMGALMPLGTAISGLAVVSYAFVLVATVMLPETKGTELLDHELVESAALPGTEEKEFLKYE